MNTSETWTCDNCLKPVAYGTRYCNECLKEIAERAAPKDCNFCGGKETAHATYLMEGDYGSPYICHNCMKDQHDGYVWKEIPGNIVNAIAERGE